MVKEKLIGQIVSKLEKIDDMKRLKQALAIITLIYNQYLINR